MTRKFERTAFENTFYVTFFTVIFYKLNASLLKNIYKTYIIVSGLNYYVITF